jgi:hypothetical protein
MVLASLGILGMACLLLLNRYKTDMIHVTILNAVLQKAPRDYPEQRIRHRFTSVFEEARRSGNVEAYLKRLLALAQRLEKIQHLEAAEVDALLENLDRDPEPETVADSENQLKNEPVLPLLRALSPLPGRT